MGKNKKHIMYNGRNKQCEFYKHNDDRTYGTSPATIWVGYDRIFRTDYITYAEYMAIMWQRYIFHDKPSGIFYKYVYKQDIKGVDKRTATFWWTKYDNIRRLRRNRTVWNAISTFTIRLLFGNIFIFSETFRDKFNRRTEYSKFNIIPALEVSQT